MIEANEAHAQEHFSILLAAALMQASGRPYSIEQALDLVRDCRFAMYPKPGLGSYQEWAKTKDERLSRIRA